MLVFLEVTAGNESVSCERRVSFLSRLVVLHFSARELSICVCNLFNCLLLRMKIIDMPFYLLLFIHQCQCNPALSIL